MTAQQLLRGVEHEKSTPDDSLTGLEKLVQQSFPIEAGVALSGKLSVKVQVTWCTAFYHLQQ